MPRKSIAKKYDGDPLVSVVGLRVAAALSVSGISHRQAAAALTELQRKAGARVYGEVTAQGIDQIAAGRRKKCRRSTRDGLAALCGGPPVTSAYLGGEEDLDIPPLLAPPSGAAGRPVHLGFVFERFPPRGSRARPDTEVPPDPRCRAALEQGYREGFARYGFDALGPHYNLVAQRLWRDIARALERDGVTRGLGPEPLNVIRYLLAMPFWRAIILRGAPDPTADSLYANDDERRLREEADEFAHHLAAAIRAVLRPWFDGRVLVSPWLVGGEAHLKLRPFILELLGRALDWVATEVAALYSVEMSEKYAAALEQDTGRKLATPPGRRPLWAELAVLDIVGPDKRRRARLRQWAWRQRAAGVPEKDIAEAIYVAGVGARVGESGLRRAPGAKRRGDVDPTEFPVPPW